MVTAVQAAVVAAAAAWVIGVGVAVYVMLKAARLMSGPPPRSPAFGSEATC